MKTKRSFLVELGKNVKIENNVKLGAGSENLGKIYIGDNSILREGTIIYHGVKIGTNFQTGHNSIVREKNAIGNYVVLGSGSELAPGNIIGDYTTIHSQCFLENATLGPYVFVAPGVKFLDDSLPIDPESAHYIGATVENDTAIGGGSVILPGVHIGRNVLIGAGSVVTKDIPSEEVWFGNPAIFIKKISELNWKREDSWLMPYVPGTRTRYNLKNLEKSPEYLGKRI